MKLIIGLGNSGKEYVGTRHNVGFDFIDLLAKHRRLNRVGESLSFKSNTKFEAEIAETQVGGEKIILIKPETFMNLSGRAVQKIVNFYKASIDDLLVVSDDLSLPVGTARIRLSGSSGGHKGLENIIQVLGDDNIKRLRIGIAEKVVGEEESDHPYEKPEAKKFVLEKFSKRQRPIIDQILEKSVDIIAECVTNKKNPLTANTFSVI